MPALPLCVIAFFSLQSEPLPGNHSTATDFSRDTSSPRGPVIIGDSVSQTATRGGFMAASDPTPGPSPGSGEPEATGVYNPLDTASELVRVLDQYLAALHAGKAPDKPRLMAEHPDLARQLEDCLAGIEFVDRAANPSKGTPARLGD